MCIDQLVMTPTSPSAASSLTDSVQLPLASSPYTSVKRFSWLDKYVCATPPGMTSIGANVPVNGDAAEVTGVIAWSSKTVLVKPLPPAR